MSERHPDQDQDEQPGADPDEDPRVTRTRTVVHATVLRLLGDEGPAAVTHARVVDESDVSRATLYRHWPDRTALLVDAIASERPRLELGELTGDFRTDLRSVLRAGAIALSNNTTMPWLLALGMRSGEDPEFDVVFERIRAMHDTPLDPIYRSGIESGALPPEVDSQLFQAMCFGTLFVLRFLWRAELTDDVVDTLTDAVLDGLARTTP